MYIYYKKNLEISWFLAYFKWLYHLEAPLEVCCGPLVGPGRLVENHRFNIFAKCSHNTNDAAPVKPQNHVAVTFFIGPGFIDRKHKVLSVQPSLR